MDKAIVTLLIALMLGGAVFASVYFFYEKPKQENAIPQYYNITIKTIDRDSNKQISTGIYITLDESTNIFYNGSTVSNGYSFVQIPKNRTFTIYNYNIKEQNNYVDVIINNDLSKEIIRFDMPITNISNISVQTLGTLGIDNPIFLKISSNGTFRNMHMCFDWSPRIIKVFLNNSIEDPIPQRFKNKVVRCFDSKTSLDNNFAIIPISYNKFGQIDESDYVKVYILDGDIIYQDKSSISSPKTEDLQGKDIGAKDVLYIIKNI